MILEKDIFLDLVTNTVSWCVGRPPIIHIAPLMSQVFFSLFTPFVLLLLFFNICHYSVFSTHGHSEQQSHTLL